VAVSEAVKPTEAATPRRAAPPVLRVSTLELFFDLVFVFAVTQVAHLFGHAHSVVDFVRAFFVLAVIWWMYGGYAWLTSNLGTSQFAHRLLLLSAMAGFLVMALRVPATAERHGVAFGLAYLLVVIVHAVMFAHAPNSSARAILGILPLNVTLALMVLASGLVSEAWNWVPWVGAGVPILATTFLHRERGFHMSPSHFVERHGLVILIALGESVVVIGTGAADQPVTLPLLAAVVLGLALAAALWWAYFDEDDTRAEHAMTHADPIRRAHLGVNAYYHAHLLMIAGIVIAAAGMQPALADPGQPTESATGWLLSSGVAVYLVGGAMFRRLLRTGSASARLIAAGVIMVLAPSGALMGSHVQVTAIILVLVAMLVAERREHAAGPAVASHE